MRRDERLHTPSDAVAQRTDRLKSDEHVCEHLEITQKMKGKIITNQFALTYVCYQTQLKKLWMDVDKMFVCTFGVTQEQANWALVMIRILDLRRF